MSTIAEVPASPAVPVPPRAEVLRRAAGIELVGEYKDSGFVDPPHIARRADGQVVQLSELLFAVAEAVDGERDVHAVATVVSDHCGRTVSADNVTFLADKHLRPLGVLALADGTTPELDKNEAFMALRHRRALLSERRVNSAARWFTWLHVPVVRVALLLVLLAFDVWLFGVHGIAGGLRSAIYNPVLLLAVFGSVVAGTAFHEFGHASACRYGGARPGVMGVGLYLVWPAFYCDITDAYRLDRAGRLRTDLGGVYFNGIFALFAGGVYAATGQEAALLAAVLQHVLALQQLLPLMRFDGYYVLTDLTGVPDILTRIRPIFRSLVRGRASEPRVAELKRWVRFVVTGYLVTLIPLLVVFFVWMVMGFPRILATVYDSFGLQFDQLRDAPGIAHAAAGVLEVVMLVLPVAAMSLSLSRVGRMSARGLRSWSRGSVPRGITASMIGAALIGAAAYTWWPNGDYEPIRPGERGTIGEAVSAVPDVVGGRPSFTPERATVFAPVATERQVDATRREAEREREAEDARDGAERGEGDGGSGAEGDEEDADLEDDWTFPDDARSRTLSGGSTSSTGTTSGSSGTTTDSGTTAAPAPSGTTTSESSGTTTTGSGTSEPAPTSTTPSETAEPTTTSESTTSEPTTTAPTTTERSATTEDATTVAPTTVPETMATQEATTVPETTTTVPVP